MLDAARSTRARTSRRVFALAAVAAIALAACGDDDDDATSATTQPASAATEAPATTANDRGLYGSSDSSATTAAPAAGGDSAVGVADSDLGQILVAGNGMTLYMFMPDAQGAPTCVDACANAWPALSAASGAPTGGDGVDASLLGTATNPQAGEQVTYNGWPLYFFSGDAAPGDTNGQGQGDVWYVLDPTGNPIDND